MSDDATNDATDGQMKSRLLGLLDTAYTRQRAFFEGLSDDERAAVGTSERWSAKDHLAHVTFWNGRLLDRLRAASRGATPETIDNFLDVNDRVFSEQRERPVQELLAADARIHQELVATVETLSEDDLAEPGRFPWRNGEPLLTDILGNPYWHAQEHLAQYWRDRGDQAQARQIHESWAAAVNQPGMPAEARAASIYNLACYYALTGDAGIAIPRLAEALRLNPRLTDWSKQDTDFAAIRDLPEFQAVYAN